MKAWQDLVNNKDITICETINSEWYLNYGCKIEMFHDGRCEVKNTMTNSDHYADVTPEQLHLFETVGWEAGAFSVCCDVYLARSKAVDYSIKRATALGKDDVAERLYESRQKLINKYVDFNTKLSNLLASL